MFHLSQEVIYTLAFFAFKKKRIKKKRIARLPSQMLTSVRIAFFFPF